ncbi:hypothetical protein [Thiohalorhabdus methylotrophus]|uniref:TCP-1/cpn60 chaperonin family protein n=1 Tax=Thiohalorhabdus methylotrophus TaxID=3242694 RepID=A0ABV4TSH7_9GAMM
MKGIGPQFQATLGGEDRTGRLSFFMTKVTRLALQNASSIASLMITTEAMVADKPEEGGEGGADMGGMGMM